MLLRSHNLDVLREERKLYWRSIYLRLEAASSNTVVASSRAASIKDAEALVEATTQLYKETVLTCFGSMGKKINEIIVFIKTYFCRYSLFSIKTKF
jgi:3-oxoacyl-ACP reductase-like protein